MKKRAWHSVKSTVHHVCTNCNTGNNIETENRKPGTGGKAYVRRMSRAYQSACVLGE